VPSDKAFSATPSKAFKGQALTMILNRSQIFLRIVSNFSFLNVNFSTRFYNKFCGMYIQMTSNSSPKNIT